MSATAIFPGLRFEQCVTGYRVSACVDPGQGFSGNFYVYVHVSVDAQNRPGQVDILEEGKPPRGTLQINDGPGVNHSFQDIDLINVLAGATHMERFRLLEFQYSPAVTDKKPPTLPTLAYDWKREVPTGQPQDDYKYDLGDGPENLLGFVARRSAVDGTSMRFTSMANGKNAWVKKILDAYKSLASFSMNITLGEDSIEVTQNNISRIYMDESYGTLLYYPQPSLSQVAKADGRLAKLDLTGHALNTLLDHLGSEFTRNQPNEIVESATFVFKPFHYRALNVK